MNAFQKHSIKAKLAPEGSKYCGWDRNNLNQLFRHKAHKQYYDPSVRSVQLEIKMKGFRENAKQARKRGKRLAKVFSELLSPHTEDAEVSPKLPVAKTAPVRKVKLSDIATQPHDGRYIFRVASDDKEFKRRYDGEVQELANSIQNNGLVHPLVLIQNGKKSYTILCGFRRFQALKRLGIKEVEARVYPEEDLTDEQCMLISLAENKDRRDWNPVEIGSFLQCAKDRLKLSDADLAMRFGEPLGIGSSHSSANKHVKLNKIRVKGESPAIINDVLKRELSFGVAAEELAFIKKPEDRNALYEKVVKPLRPKKPELRDIKKLFGEMGNGFKSTLAKKNVKAAIKQAQESEDKGQELIKQLKLLVGDDLTKQKKEFEDKVATIRKSVFGKDATEEQFSVIPPPDMEKNELTLHFKVTDESLDGTVDNIKKLLKGKRLRQLMDLVANP